MAGNPDRPSNDVAVLDVIGDEDCRRLIRLLASEGPKSVRTLHERTGIAQSTLYRKMDRVSETPLVVAETHLDTGGRQPTRYRLVADGISVDLDDPVDVTVQVPGAEGAMDAEPDHEPSDRSGQRPNEQPDGSDVGPSAQRPTRYDLQ